jgi:hypothetical protein
MGEPLANERGQDPVRGRVLEPALVGDGDVWSTRERDATSGEVKVTIEAIDQRGEPNAVGWAVVVLPRRPAS